MKNWKTHNHDSSNWKKITRIDENEEEITKNISYRLQFIVSARFMAKSLSNLSIILMKEFIKLNVNTSTMIKAWNCLIVYKYCVYFL